MTAIVLGLLSSLSFALSVVASNRGVHEIDYFSGLVINLATNALFLWVFFLISLPLSSESIEIWAPINFVFVGVGLLAPGLARFFILKGMQRLGAAISGALVNTTPLYAIGLAVAFLGETPTPTNLAGALVMVAGVVCLSWRGESKTWATRDLVFPVIGAFLFALRDTLARFGLLSMNSPVLGAALSATTSALTMGVIYAAWVRRGSRPRLSERGARFFLFSGAMSSVSYLCMFTALSLDRVSIVSPLVNGSSLFILPLSYFLLRGIDVLNGRKIASALMVVFGVFLISWEKL
jgi:drug/metabolite transporter (DMT)-like permease